jgi:site-specific DNA-methyltransferase (adenine-specific)/modification methylase
MEQATETLSMAEPISGPALRSSAGPCWASADGNVQLWNADCLDILPFLVGIDAIVSDPPYGIDFDCSKKRTRSSAFSMGITPLADRQWKKIHGDNKPFDPTPWINFEKVILWGANHYADKLPPSTKPVCWLVWDKKLDTTPDNFSDCELAWTNLPGVVKKFSHLWRGMVRAGRENITNGPKLHPFQKPEALMFWCLQQCRLLPGSVVLDPYMGSGTTGVACIKYGMKFVGIESDPEHFEIAKERIRKELQQRRLF